MFEKNDIITEDSMMDLPFRYILESMSSGHIVSLMQEALKEENVLIVPGCISMLASRGEYLTIHNTICEMIEKKGLNTASSFSIKLAAVLGGLSGSKILSQLGKQIQKKDKYFGLKDLKSFYEDADWFSSDNDSVKNSAAFKSLHEYGCVNTPKRYYPRELDDQALRRGEPLSGKASEQAS